MNRRSVFWALGALLGIALLTGCSAQVTGTPLAVRDSTTQSRTTPPRTTTPRTTPPRTTPPRTTTPRPPSVPVFQGAVGDCVGLGGTETAPEISLQSCGSAQANYKIVAVADSHDHCPSDADGWYANTLNNAETTAFCLDVDWVVGDCYTLYPGWPARVDCASASPETVRLAAIGPGSDGSACDEQAHVYPERRMVACLDTPTRSS